LSAKNVIFLALSVGLRRIALNVTVRFTLTVKCVHVTTNQRKSKLFVRVSSRQDKTNRL